MERSLGAGLGQFLLILARAGLKAIQSAGSTERDLGELNTARLFSGTREARTRGKTNISGAPTLALGLFPWQGDYVLPQFKRYPMLQIACHFMHLAKIQ